jgi:hypothetical protein
VEARAGVVVGVTKAQADVVVVAVGPKGNRACRGRLGDHGGKREKWSTASVGSSWRLCLRSVL